MSGGAAMAADEARAGMGAAGAGAAPHGHPAPAIAFLLFGMLFALLLSKAGATTYDYYAALFLFRDLQLMWVIGAGALTGALLIALLRAAGARVWWGGGRVEPAGKPMRRGLLPGALLLGLGWGLAGACPGTVLVMAGEGKTSALWTIAGVGLGTWLYGLLARGRAVEPEATVDNQANAPASAAPPPSPGV